MARFHQPRLTLHCVGDQWLHQQLNFTFTKHAKEARISGVITYPRSTALAECLGANQACHQLTSPLRDHLGPGDWVLVVAGFRSSFTHIRGHEGTIETLFSLCTFRTSIFTDVGELFPS